MTSEKTTVDARCVLLGTCMELFPNGCASGGAAATAGRTDAFAFAFAFAAGRLIAAAMAALAAVKGAAMAVVPREHAEQEDPFIN